MNSHKKKCDQLKRIRKTLADGLGIDLQQRECTFEGECRGTCPKCRQEEELLNRALLGKAAAAAAAVTTSVLLAGCGPMAETEGMTAIVESGPPETSWEQTEGIAPSEDLLTGEIELEEGGTEPEETILEGDVAYEVTEEQVL